MYRLTRAVTSSAMPASRRSRPARILSSPAPGAEDSAPVTGHPVAVWVGAFAASAVSADQVAIAFPAGCRLVGHARAIRLLSQARWNAADGIPSLSVQNRPANWVRE